MSALHSAHILVGFSPITHFDIAFSLFTWCSLWIQDVSTDLLFVNTYFEDFSQVQQIHPFLEKDTDMIAVKANVGSSLIWFSVPVHWPWQSHLLLIHLCFLLLWPVLWHYWQILSDWFLWLNEMRHVKCQKQNKCAVIISVDDNKMVRTMVTKTGCGLWM